MGRLHAVVGEHGSILVYNAAFEKAVLSGCADLFPEFQPWVDGIKHRIVDKSCGGGRAGDTATLDPCRKRSRWCSIHIRDRRRRRCQ